MKLKIEIFFETMHASTQQNFVFSFSEKYLENPKLSIDESGKTLRYDFLYRRKAQFTEKKNIDIL